MDKEHLLISNVQRFSFHDGPGLRTTVFTKGCNLHCSWCHNPETQLPNKQLQYTSIRCRHCSACIMACPVGALHSDGMHIVPDFSQCQQCGACTEACWTGALTMIGRKLTKQELLSELKKDRNIFPDFGGLTISGGEPLLQSTQLAAILPAVKAEGYHVAIDTAANVPWDCFASILPYTDLILFDLKVMSNDVHRIYTGVENCRILENYVRLADRHMPLQIRVPLVHSVNDNDENITMLRDFLKKYPPAERLDILHYHSLGRAKAKTLGWEQPLFEVPTSERLEQIKESLRGCAKSIYIL